MLTRGGAGLERRPRRPGAGTSSSVRGWRPRRENSISASRPSVSRAQRTQRTRLGERLRRAIDPQLVLEVDVAGGDEHVQVGPLGDADRLDGAAAGRRPGSGPGPRPRSRPSSRGRSGWTASKSPGEAAGKPASMTSTRSRASCRATSSFSAAVSAGARRLLAVAQGGVEDPDGAGRDPAAEPGRRRLAASSRDLLRRYAGRHRLRPGRPRRRPARGTASWPRRSAPTCSIWWSRSCCAEPRELRAPPASCSEIQRVGERAVLDVAQDVLHRRP